MNTLKIGSSYVDGVGQSSKILDRIGNKALVKSEQVHGTIYWDIAEILVNNENESLRLRGLGLTEGDDQLATRYPKSQSEVQQIWDSMLDEIKQKERNKKMTSEADSLKARKLSDRIEKIAEAQRLKYEARGKIKDMISNAKNVRDLSKSKKMVTLINEVLIYDTIINN